MIRIATHQHVTLTNHYRSIALEGSVIDYLGEAGGGVELKLCFYMVPVVFSNIFKLIIYICRVSIGQREINRAQ